jgi:hypothetical protein
MLLENCEVSMWSTFRKPLVAISADAAKHGEVENVTRRIGRTSTSRSAPLAKAVSENMAQALFGITYDYLYQSHLSE